MFQGKNVACDPSDTVCAGTGGKTYGTVYEQLTTIMYLLQSPVYMHRDCPNPDRNTIEKDYCVWKVAYGQEYCTDSVYQGMYSLLKCKRSCVTTLKFVFNV